MSSITSKFYKSGRGGSSQAPSTPSTSGVKMSSQGQEGQRTGGVGRYLGEERVAAQGERKREEEREGRGKVGDGEGDTEGWDEEEWEVRWCGYYDVILFDCFTLFIQDFNISGEQTQAQDSGCVGGGGMGEGGEEGGMEEWEDDGWGTFEQPEEKKSIPSSGADFFDMLEDNNVPEKKESEDLFERLGVGVGGGTKGGKRPSPPPVSASLFGSSTAGGGRGEGGREKVDEDVGDWGDWGSDFSSKQVCITST